MEDRKEEIEFVLGMVTKLCEESDIRLIAKESKGMLYVAVQDALDEKIYAVIKS